LRPQAPQFCELVLRLVSQPFVALPSQLPKPALHVKPHLPPLQVVTALVRLGQMLPQAPQLLRSVLVLTHVLPHLVKPLLQVKLHVPALHVAVALAGATQTLPQLPQFCASVCTLTQLLPHLV
jgi:hypothetical protein